MTVRGKIAELRRVTGAYSPGAGSAIVGGSCPQQKDEGSRPAGRRLVVATDRRLQQIVHLLRTTFMYDVGRPVCFLFNQDQGFHVMTGHVA